MPRVQPEGKDRISIHALLTEGDTEQEYTNSIENLFQSTPSSRRATSAVAEQGRESGISIHALLTEGDSKGNAYVTVGVNFNPRPPHGGRLSVFRKHCTFF